MEIAYVRDPTDEEIGKSPKWSATTERVLEALKSKRSVTNKELQQMTGYKLSTINAQISILRRMGLVENTHSIVRATQIAYQRRDMISDALPGSGESEMSGVEKSTVHLRERDVMSTIPSLERFLDRVICGDSSKVLKEIRSESVNTIVTSPPYYQQRDYGGVGIGMESTLDEYVDALLYIFTDCVRVTREDGSIFVVLGDKYEDGSLLLAPYVFAKKVVEKTGVKLINQITWVKPNPEPRQFKRRLVPGTEPIFHFVKSKNYRYYPERFMAGPNAVRDRRNSGGQIGKKYFALMDNSDLSDEQKRMAKEELQKVIQEVKDGTIWSFRMKIRGIHSAAYGGYEGGRRDHIRVKGYTIIRMYDRPIKRDVIEAPILNLKYLKHPSIYPEVIVQECLNLTTDPGDVVLDPFLGSGTTAVVAKRMGRHFIGIEINKEYCETAEDRIRRTLVQPSLLEFYI